MDKSRLIKLIRQRLETQLETMTKAARSAHDAATGDESKAEGKYDTRGLEASYLAEAQAAQCQKLESSIRTLENFTLQEAEAIESGSLIEMEQNGEISCYFLLPCAGGTIISEDSIECTVLAPDAPLYDLLLGHEAGDLLEPQDILILDVA